MIDTKVEGDPAAVTAAATAAATWLRDTLAKNLEQAGDEQQDARNDSRSRWEGETASSYRNVAGDVLKATDKHEERVKPGGDRARRLRGEAEAARGRHARHRTTATGGGLTVEGTVIHQPPDAPSASFVEGSPEEAAYDAAVDKVEVWNTLVEDIATDYRTFVDWVDTNLPTDVADAKEKDASDTLFDTMKDLFPNFAAGAGAGLAGFAMLGKASDYKAEAREFRRKSRVSGDPRVRGSADTPAGRAKLDDLLGKAEWLKKGGRFFGGPAGIAIDIGFGIDGALRPVTGPGSRSRPAPASRSASASARWSRRAWSRRRPGPWCSRAAHSPPARPGASARSTTTGTTSPTGPATAGTTRRTRSATPGTR